MFKFKFETNLKPSKMEEKWLSRGSMAYFCFKIQYSGGTEDYETVDLWLDKNDVTAHFKAK